MKKMNFLYTGVVLVIAGFLVRAIGLPPQEPTSLDTISNIVFVLGVLMVLIGIVLEEKKKRRAKRMRD